MKKAFRAGCRALMLTIICGYAFDAIALTLRWELGHGVDGVGFVKDYFGIWLFSLLLGINSEDDDE